MLLSPLWTILKIIGALFGLIAAVISLSAAINQFRISRKKKALLESRISERFVRQFGKRELDDHLRSYVVPHCSPSDPSNREGEEFLADIREPIFSYIDRTVSTSGKSYQLLLADTGMGKTTFCLNYLSHARRKFPQYEFALVSLASKGCDSHIRGIANKTDTILIADAFDEDPKGWENGRERLSDLLELSEDFKSVIITCISQYFISDDAIPRETPLPVLVPRTLGQGQMFHLTRSYISPFSPDEINKYIDQIYPLLYFWQWPMRRKAFDLLKSIPDLAHRPMLLERLSELINQKISSNEIFELYNVLIEGWLRREDRWIDKDKPVYPLQPRWLRPTTLWRRSPRSVIHGRNQRGEVWQKQHPGRAGQGLNRRQWSRSSSKTFKWLSWLWSMSRRTRLARFRSLAPVLT